MKTKSHFTFYQKVFDGEWYRWWDPVKAEHRLVTKPGDVVTAVFKPRLGQT